VLVLVERGILAAHSCRSATTDTPRRNIPLAVVRTPRSNLVARMAAERTNQPVQMN
jgi:hypothetical protein